MRDFNDSITIENPIRNTKLRQIDLRSLKHWLIYSCRYMSWRTGSWYFIIRDNFDINLLGNPFVRGMTTSTRRCTVLPFFENVVDTSILKIVGVAGFAVRLSRLSCFLLTSSTALGKRATELVGTSNAGELAHRRDDQRPYARNRRGDDDYDVFDITPANQFDTAGRAKISDTGKGIELCSLDDRCNHRTKLSVYRGKRIPV